MVKQKTIILLLLGLILGSASGFFKICDSDNGHFAIESILNDHCQHPTDYADDLNFSSDYGHCNDSLVSLNVFPLQKNIKPSIQKVFVNYVLTNSQHSTSYFNYTTESSGEFPSFYMPLRSIILLS